MAFKVPTTRSISWITLIIEFVIIWSCVYWFIERDEFYSYLYAGLIYIGLAIILRNIFASYHKKGMQLVKKNKFEEAIPWFEKSVQYFKAHQWIDKYRKITLLSPSRISYTEISMCNIAFCYTQSGNGPKAVEYYELILKEFPESGLARTCLNTLKSMEQKVTEA